MIKKNYMLVSVILLSVFLSLPALSVGSPEPLTMGIFPRRNAKTTFDAFTPLAEYLSEKLGRKVRLEASSSFSSFWEGVETLRYDLVHYNQYHYIRSHKKLGYSVIAMNEEFGKSTITGTIVVKKGSGVTTIKDLKNKKIVFGGGPKAMMSYIVPRYLLQQAGLSNTDYQEEFAPSPPNAILATFFGLAAAAGTGDVVLDLPEVTGACDTTKLLYLLKGEPLSHLPWALKPGMSEQEASQIQSALIELKTTARGRKILQRAGLTGILKADDRNYDQHRKITLAIMQENYFVEGERK